MPKAPDWLLGIDPDRLRRDLGEAVVERGAAYARAGRVTSLRVEDDGRRVHAGVRGSGSRTYTTVVGDPEDQPVAGQCSCPVQVDCKHVAAVVLSVQPRGGRRLAQPPSSEPRAAPLAAWEASLAGLVLPQAADPGEPLGLLVELAGARVRVRPVRRAATGRWVRTGVSWRDLGSAYGRLRPHPDHRAALTDLWTTWRARRPAWTAGDTPVHLDEVGPSVWRLLREAERVGVRLLDGDGEPTVRLAAAPGVLVADLRRERGGLVVRTVLRVPGEPDAESHLLVDRPATGAVVEGPDGLLLAAFDTPLDPAVEGLADALLVPAADEARFLARYYPALRRRLEVLSSDGSVELPELAPPRLLLDARFEADHVTRLVWQFAYRTGEVEVLVPVAGPTDAVTRDAPAEAELLDGLDDLPDSDGVWCAPAGRRRPLATAVLTGVLTARFASVLLPQLQAHDGLTVEVEGTPTAYVEVLEPPTITVSTHDLDTSRDWFGLAVTVTIGGQDVPLGQLLSALARGQGHLVLVSGAWFSLDRPELQTLRRLLAEARHLQDRTRPGLRLSPLQVGLWEELVAIGVVAEQSERWTRTVAGLLNLDEVPRPDPPACLQAELRPYQLEGYAWVSLLWDLGLGGVLADDMGLGKTVQALAAIARAHERGLEAPVLVVAPTSVVGAWVAEAARFCPDLPVVAVTGTERKSGQSLAERIEGAAVVVTSYALLRLDDDAYLAQAWGGLVLDEAQHVKNRRSRTYAVCRRLATPFTLAITGTPLENSLMDLWSLLSLTAPGLFPDPENFAETWQRPIEVGGQPALLAAFRARIRPLVLRRTKEQVARELPAKVEQVLEVPLHPGHRRVYDRHLQRERQRLLGLLEDLPRNRLAVLRALTLLRQLSLDACLVDPSLDLPSAKVDALAGLLQEVAGEGHRALVFSSFTGFLARVRQRLDADGIGYCYLDGRTRDRQRVVERFRTGSDPAFLISLKAGGTGLTLTEADYVFVLDPWWNPAVEAQAVDRAHRIGQDKTVMVYRLVATDTVEQKVVALQQRKRALFTSVVDGDGAAPGALTAEDFRALLA